MDKSQRSNYMRMKKSISKMVFTLLMSKMRKNIKKLGIAFKASLKIKNKKKEPK